VDADPYTLCSSLVKDHAVNERVTDDAQVRSLSRACEIGVVGRYAATLPMV
jgi:hypothetical protein